MGFGNKLPFMLSKITQKSIKECRELIFTKQIWVNNVIGTQNTIVTFNDEIKWNDLIIQPKVTNYYFIYYKPVGIECTLNSLIDNNLLTHLKFDFDFFPIGRLDKDSEGLLLLTNDGQLMKRLLPHEKQIEKEYFVTVNDTINDHFIQKMQNGIEILGKITQRCEVSKISKFTFRIVLKEGMNRQIRRMCYKLNYTVTKLIRVRIHNLTLGDLQSGDWRYLTEREITKLF